MVDVGAKAQTERVAVARGRIEMKKATLTMVEKGSAKKGDVLGVARIAAIQGAKRTSELIPLAHPLALTRITIDFSIDRKRHSIVCTSTTATRDRTGVEMEALTSVATGLLTIYDMCKAIDRGMRILDIELVEKKGGKSGHWLRNAKS